MTVKGQGLGRHTRILHLMSDNSAVRTLCGADIEQSIRLLWTTVTRGDEALREDRWLRLCRKCGAKK